MSLRFVALVTVLSLFTGFISIPQASADEPLAVAVKESIDKGVRYLKHQAEENGGRWESPLFPAKYKGGMTCLATLALLTAGEKPSGWLTEKKILSFIRELHPTTTYVYGLQTMVLAEVNDVRDITTIRTNVEWLLKSRVYNNGKLAGWWYEEGIGANPDNSNTQYALLGLYAGKTYLANHDAKSPIQQQDWEEIQRYYIDTMQRDGRGGGWAYQTGTEIRHTMTMAGLSGLFIAGLELDVSDQQLNEKTGIAAKCGTYKENQTIANALEVARFPSAWRERLGKKLHLHHAWDLVLQHIRHRTGRQALGRAVSRGARLVSGRVRIAHGEGPIRSQPEAGRLLGVPLAGDRRRHEGRIHEFRSLIPGQGQNAEPGEQARLRHEDKLGRVEPQAQRHSAYGGICQPGAVQEAAFVLAGLRSARGRPEQKRQDER